MSTDGTRVIELSRMKLVLLVAGSLLFMAAGVWFVVAPEDGSLLRTLSRFVPPIAVRALGVAAIVFFGGCAVFGVRKSFDERPGLVLSPEGMTDNASAVAAGFIPWSEITGMSEFAFQRQRMLVIHVTDVEKYVARGGALKRAMNRANAGMCGSPVVISSNALRIPYDELRRVVEAYGARYAGQGREAPAPTG